MILIESSFFPFFLTSFHGVGYSDAELGAMFEAIAATAQRAQREHTRYVSIAVGATSMSPAERKTVASLTDAMPRALSDVVLGSYVILESPVARGMLTALCWLSPRIAMVEPASSAEGAMAAATADFDAEGIAVESALVSGARRWLRTEVDRQKQGHAPPSEPL